MAKMTRERTVKERRALKQQKKDERSQAAAAARSTSDDNSTLSVHLVDEAAPAEPLAGA
jgi:hypothetical protein